MNNALKPVVVIGVVALAVAGVVFYSQWAGAHAKDLVPWTTDLAAGQADARQTGKKVFAYFTATWCGPCQQLKATTWSDSKVADELKSYVPIKLDVDQQQAVAVRYGVQSIPTFVVLTDTGDVVQQWSGYMDAGEFLRWLK